MDRLSRIYWDLQMEEPLGLEEFCEKVLAGAYGPGDPKALRIFLRAVEEKILQNIEAKAEEDSRLARLKDARVRETREWIDALIARSCGEG